MRNIKTIFMVIAVAAMAGCSHIPSHENNNERERRNCKDGICLELHANRKDFNFSTKRINLYVTFENVSDNRIIIDPCGRLIIGMKGEGATLSPLPVGVWPPPGLLKPISLLKNQKYTEALYDLRTYGSAWNIEPGDYQVSVKYRFDRENIFFHDDIEFNGFSVWCAPIKIGQQSNEYVWHGEIESYPISIRKVE